MADLVVSGSVESTTPNGTRAVNGIDLDANIARLHADRIFKGNFTSDVQFTWFTFHVQVNGSGGFAYAGPPLANFVPGKRYLVFLRREGSDWTVAMPLYGLEAELGPAPPARAPQDVSAASARQRNGAIADELEQAARLTPPPAPGVTGKAAVYFPEVFDLIGACGEPFYREFLSSPQS